MLCGFAIDESGQCSKPTVRPNEFGRQLVGDADASAASQWHRVSEEIVGAIMAFRSRGCRLDIERKRAIFLRTKYCPGYILRDARDGRACRFHRSFKRLTEFESRRYFGLKKKI